MAKHKKNPAQDFHNLMTRGTAALHQGKVDEARNLLEQAHKLDQSQGDAILNLAGAYILSKRFKQAVELLEPLTRTEPDNPMVWTNLGAAYLGNPVLASEEHQQKAIAAFEKALEIDPQVPNVAYNLGLIYRDRQEYDQALTWFRRALETNPNDKDARQFIAFLSQDSNGHR